MVYPAFNRKRGKDPEDYTSDVPSQRYWSITNVPPILGQLHPLDPDMTHPEPRLMKYAIHGKMLRDFPNVLPDRISSCVESFLLEAWFRSSSKLQWEDIIDRILPTARWPDLRRRLQEDLDEFRNTFQLHTWWEYLSKQKKSAEETRWDKNTGPAANNTIGLAPSSIVDPNTLRGNPGKRKRIAEEALWEKNVDPAAHSTVDMSLGFVLNPRDDPSIPRILNPSNNKKRIETAVRTSRVRRWDYGGRNSTAQAVPQDRQSTELAQYPIISEITPGQHSVRRLTRLENPRDQTNTGDLVNPFSEASGAPPESHNLGASPYTGNLMNPSPEASRAPPESQNLRTTPHIRNLMKPSSEASRALPESQNLEPIPYTLDETSGEPHYASYQARAEESDSSSGFNDEHFADPSLVPAEDPEWLTRVLDQENNIGSHNTDQPSYDDDDAAVEGRGNIHHHDSPSQDYATS